MIPSSHRSSVPGRTRYRLWQVEAACLTGMTTAWCVTLGPLPAILALLVAKHVLVALLVAGLDHERQESPAPAGGLPNHHEEGTA